MEAIITVIQTLGFPIACVVGLGFFIWKFVTRIQDENKQREENYQKREDNYQTLLVMYGEKMAEISAALERITQDLNEMKAK